MNFIYFKSLRAADKTLLRNLALKGFQKERRERF